MPVWASDCTDKARKASIAGTIFLSIAPPVFALAR
jgi:hypothetical protein